MFSKHKKQHNLGCFEGYSHLFLEDFIVVKPRPSGYLAIASNKATIQNNYTVQENPGLSYMNLHAWHVFKEVSIFSMCFHVFRFLSMSSKSHRLINASSWCVQSISISKAVGCWAWLVHKWAFLGKNNGKQSRTDLGKETISFTKS